MQNQKKVICIITAIIITLSQIINLSKPTTSYIENLNNINLYLSLFAFICIYKLVYKRFGKEKNKLLYSILALIMAVVNSIAYFYHYYGNLDLMFNPIYQIFKVLIFIIGQSLMFYYIFSYISQFFIKLRKKDYKNKITEYIFEKHPIKCTIIFLLILYIPLIFITFPGDMSPDGFDELKQFYHINTWSVSYLNLLDENIYINNHHSVIHTIIIGVINEIGNRLASPNIGLFLNVLVQIMFTIFVLTYSIKAMKDLKVPIPVRIGVLLFYGFSGFILIPSTAIYKDVPFSLLVLLYSTMLMKIVCKDKVENKEIITISIVALLMSLMAKKGIYALILVSICLLFLKNISKLNKIVLTTPIILYFLLDSIIFPSLGITPGSSREMLSIPLQQVSRTVVYHDDELSKTDKQTINEIIEYDQIKEKYNAKNADPIKNELFKKDYTEDEMSNFIKLYISLFFKYPKTYIDAFLNNTSGYFYLGRTVGPGGYSTDEFRMTSSKITYSKSEWRKDIMKSIDKIYDLIQKVPVINLIYVLAIYIWIPIYSVFYVISKKDKEKIIPLIPAIVMILFLLVSPVNNNRRYVFPLIYTVPMIVAYISTIKNKKVKEKYNEK